jgi:hypothetical protein
VAVEVAVFEDAQGAVGGPRGEGDGDLARFSGSVSISRRVLMSQAKTKRVGARGRARRTSGTPTVGAAVNDVAVDAGPTTISAVSVRWWSGFHQVCVSSVKAAKARSIGASTVISDRTAVLVPCS